MKFGCRKSEKDCRLTKLTDYSKDITFLLLPTFGCVGNAHHEGQVIFYSILKKRRLFLHFRGDMVWFRGCTKRYGQAMTHPEAENSHCHIKDVFGHDTSKVTATNFTRGKCERNRLCSGINSSRL